VTHVDEARRPAVGHDEVRHSLRPVRPRRRLEQEPTEHQQQNVSYMCTSE
jgi:hypothetical protein